MLFVPPGRLAQSSSFFFPIAFSLRSLSGLTLDRVEIFFPDTGPAPEFRLSQARQGSTTSPPPGSQLLSVSGQRRLQHNLSAQVRLCVSRERFRRNKACA